MNNNQIAYELVDYVIENEEQEILSMFSDCETITYTLFGGYYEEVDSIIFEYVDNNYDNISDDTKNNILDYIINKANEYNDTDYSSKDLFITEPGNESDELINFIDTLDRYASAENIYYESRNNATIETITDDVIKRCLFDMISEYCSRISNTSQYTEEEDDEC